MSDVEKKWRRLTQWLVLSVTLNVGLSATLCLKTYYQSRSGVKAPLAPRSIEKTMQSNSEILDEYFRLSFYELVDELQNKAVAEEGFRFRDLALSCLVDFHYLDVNRSLSGVYVQSRRMNFIHHEGHENIELSVFPALSDEHFEAILSFIQRERWPFTCEGLFIELSTNSSLDNSLVDAFVLSEPFQLIEKLFARSFHTMESSQLLTLLLEGEWTFIDRFWRTQMKGVDLSPGMYEAFLLQYIEFGSHLAAEHVIEQGIESMMRHMDDPLMCQLIDLVQNHSSNIETFLKRMAISVRSDSVRQKAALKLFELQGKVPPTPYDHTLALKQLLPSHVVVQESRIETSSWKSYKVQPGDSLWLIAKKYGTSVDEILKKNEIDSKHRLSVGMELVIP